jgi:hypothetical protein
MQGETAVATKYFVVEFKGQFISRFCDDRTFLVEDLGSARLFPTVESARETAQLMSLRLRVRPSEFKVHSVYADLDIPYPKITMSGRYTGTLGVGHATG